MADLPHTRVRYLGTEPILYGNIHRDIHEQPVSTGDIIEIPTHEVESWGDTPPTNWEIVDASTKGDS